VLSDIGGKFISPDFSQIAPSNRDVLIFVHGFRQNGRKVIQHALELKEQIAAFGLREDVCVVGFEWPCHFHNYVAARSKTYQAGDRLAQLIQVCDMIWRLEVLLF
jgi:esterase/lipase superfamily enzyme